MAVTKIKGPSDGAMFTGLQGTCGACSKCFPDESVEIQPAWQQEFEWSVKSRNLYRLLWNSLGKPILGAVGAALLAELAGLDETLSIFFVVSGFAAGFFCCYALPLSVLEEKRVS